MEKNRKKIEVGYLPSLLARSLKLLKSNFNKSIYILWNDLELPVVKTDLDSIIQHFDSVIALETWFFNPYDGYVIEVPTSCLITVGLIQHGHE